MSPVDPSRNVPISEMLPVGGTQIGENELEREGTESGGSDGAGEGGQLAIGGSGGVAGAELSAGETGVGAVSRRRGQGVAAPQLRAAVESGAPGGVSPGGARAGGGALCGFRSHAGERAPGQRRWPAGPCRELAAVDARTRGCGVGNGSGNRIASGGNVGRISANCCNWMAAFIAGWKSAPTKGV